MIKRINALSLIILKVYLTLKLFDWENRSSFFLQTDRKIDVNRTFQSRTLIRNLFTNCACMILTHLNYTLNAMLHNWAYFTFDARNAVTKEIKGEHFKFKFGTQLNARIFYRIRKWDWIGSNTIHKLATLYINFIRLFVHLLIGSYI